MEVQTRDGRLLADPLVAQKLSTITLRQGSHKVTCIKPFSPGGFNQFQSYLTFFRPCILDGESCLIRDLPIQNMGATMISYLRLSALSGQTFSLYNEWMARVCLIQSFLL